MSKIAFLFPGQGAQSVGMGSELIASRPAASALFDRASSVLGYDLAEVCTKGPAEKLDSTEFSQPAIFVASLAALETLKEDQPELVEQCSYTAGLSLGEYTALVFAGAMEFEAALSVVRTRGEAMQAAADLVESGMVSVLGLELPQVEELCDKAREEGEILQVANLLCPGNIVVSGHSTACQRIADLATEAGAMKVLPLAVAGAFHTQLMQPAVERLAAALSEVTITSPRIPVISNVDAKSHNDPEEIRQLLKEQVVSPVLWETSLRNLLEVPVDKFYEIGPGRVLRGLLRRINRKLECENITA